MNISPGDLVVVANGDEIVRITEFVSEKNWLDEVRSAGALGLL